MRGTRTKKQVKKPKSCGECRDGCTDLDAFAGRSGAVVIVIKYCSCPRGRWARKSVLATIKDAYGREKEAE